jgi:O-antigen ligase
MPVNDHIRVFKLVDTWAALIPLFYFASRGHFWFQDVSDSVALLDLSGIRSGGNKVEYVVMGLSVFSIVFLLMLSRIFRLIDAFLHEKVFALLSILAVASSAWSQLPMISLEYSLCFAGSTMFAFYLHYRFNACEQLRIFYLLGWICIVFSIVLALFFPQYGVDTIAGNSAWRGMFGYKNACGMSIAFLLTVGFYVPAASLHSKILRIFYVALFVFVLIMNKSVTAWMLVFCMVVCFVFTRTAWNFRKLDRLIITGMGLAIACSVFSVVLFYSTEFSYAVGKDPTLTGRTEIWSGVITSALKRPILGYGYQGFFNGLQGESANMSLKGGLVANASHNGFLDVFVTLGGVGLLLVLVSFARAFINALACFSKERSPYFSWFICIVFLMIVANIDEKAMMVPNDLIWVFYVIACLGLADGATQLQMKATHA